MYHRQCNSSTFSRLIQCCFTYDSLKSHHTSSVNKIPNPRQTIRLTFKQTPRIFKTPVRESALKQEEDFIAKNGQLMRTSCHFNVDSLDISENDPYWRKKKGDIFLKG